MSAHNEPAQAAPDELDAAIARIQADMCANECPCCADGRTLISALARLRAELAAARADLRAEEKGQDNLRRCLASAEAERDALRADAERWLNLLRGYRKMVNAVAPHFDKPITDDNVVLWLNLNNAGATVDAALDAAREGNQ